MAIDDVIERTNQTYSLIGQQLIYLVTGETGEDGPSSLEETITERHSSLPARFQYLIEDAALLRTAEFIDVEDWEAIWDDIVESAGGNSAYSPPRAIKNVQEDDFPFYQFGIQLGHLARLLSKDSAPEFEETEIAFGFLLGIAGEFLYDPELTSRPSEDASVEGGQFDIPLASSLVGPTDDEKETLDSLRRSIIESQFDAPISYEEITAGRALEKYGLPTDAPLRDEVWARARDIDYPPSDSLIESVAKKLTEDKRLDQAEETVDVIATDLNVLSSKKSGKKDHPVFAAEVFCAVCSQSEPTRTAIHDAVREPRIDKPADQTINKLRNDLQGEGTDNRHWEEYL